MKHLDHDPMLLQYTYPHPQPLSHRGRGGLEIELFILQAQYSHKSFLGNIHCADGFHAFFAFFLFF